MKPQRPNLATVPAGTRAWVFAWGPYSDGTYREQAILIVRWRCPCGARWRAWADRPPVACPNSSAHKETS